MIWLIIKWHIDESGKLTHLFYNSKGRYRWTKKPPQKDHSLYKQYIQVCQKMKELSKSYEYGSLQHLEKNDLNNPQPSEAVQKWAAKVKDRQQKEKIEHLQKRVDLLEEKLEDLLERMDRNCCKIAI